MGAVAADSREVTIDKIDLDAAIQAAEDAGGFVAGGGPATGIIAIAVSCHVEPRLADFSPSEKR
jgi:hypothetical protein